MRTPPPPTPGGVKKSKEKSPINLIDQNQLGGGYDRDWGADRIKPKKM